VPTRRDGGAEAGFATLVLPLLLWVVTLATVALIDVTAYLVAAARAQSLADAAALAAVSVDATVPARGSPLGRARTVVAAGDGLLERCGCVQGTGHAETVVSVAVPGLVLPRLGAGRVEATARAVLAPPGGLAARTRPYPALQPAAVPVVEEEDAPRS
jgi:hypothetical protein